MHEADPRHSNCPVRPLALEAARVIKQRAYFDGRDSDLFKHLTEKLANLETAASRLEASSHEGLVFQVLLANEASDLLIYHDDDAENRKVGQRTERCLASVVLALRNAATDELVAYYMSHTLRLRDVAA